MRTISQVFYSLAIYCLLPVLFGYFLWRSLREPDYRRRWLERLGFIQSRAPGCLWIHAASVGETQAAMPLMERLLKRYPERRLVVSSFTPTGAALVRQRLGDRVDSVYLPVDTPLAVARFLRRLQPSAGIIIETELWPNLLLACGSRGIPMLLASATLSERSAKAYRRFPGLRLMCAALQAFQVVAVQTEADAQRFAALGVRDGRIETSGNLKFDLAVDSELPGHAATLRHTWRAIPRPVWIAASTHEGEEQIAINCCKSLQSDYPNQLMILVPRHPQRFDAVAALLTKAELRFARRSLDQAVSEDTQVLLVDTLGELMLFYAMADAVFVGGSLVPIGGHNLLEPAALAKPIITGPYCESQQQLLDLLDARAAVRKVGDEKALLAAIAELLADPDSRQVMGKAANAVVRDNRGSIDSIEGALARILILAA